MLGDEQILDNAPTDEMLLDDAFERGWIARAVPGALGVHECDRPPFADAQAIRFRAKNPPLLRQPELPQALFQKIPGRETALVVTALRLRLIAAKKDVASRDEHAD